MSALLCGMLIIILGTCEIDKCHVRCTRDRVLGDALPVLFSALEFCLFGLLLFVVCKLADFVLALYLPLLVQF